MPTKSALAAKIEALRIERGWTKDHLARTSGVSERTVRRIEKGETPSLDTLQALAAAFNIDCKKITCLMREEPKPRARTPMLLEIGNGHDLLNALAGAHAFAADADHAEDDETASLVAGLLDAIELADIYDELSPSARYEEGRRLTDLLTKLREQGWGVCVVRETRTLHPAGAKPITNWKIARLCVKNLGMHFDEALKSELEKLVAEIPATEPESIPN